MSEIQLHIYGKMKREEQQSAILRAADNFSSKEISPPLKIVRSEGGKPYFEGRSDLFFSVSHSGDFFVVAISSSEIGVDLQQHRTANVTAIPQRFFHREEAAFLERHPERFFDVWAAKESYVKYTGEGVARGFRHFSCLDEDHFKTAINGVFLIPVSFRADYSLFVCAEEKNSISVFCEDDFN